VTHRRGLGLLKLLWRDILGPKECVTQSYVLDIRHRFVTNKRRIEVKENGHVKLFAGLDTLQIKAKALNLVKVWTLCFPIPRFRAGEEPDVVDQEQKISKGVRQRLQLATAHLTKI
jgi:hypothetical protein